MKLIDFEYSNIGERTTQQDFFGKIVNEREAIFVVADGMGGRKGGAMASEIATKTILNSFNNNIQSDSRRDQIRQSIYEANKLILRTGSSNPDLSGMGTTIAILFINEQSAYTFHVGDSRVYQFRDGQLIYKTKDHSKVSEMVENSILSEEEARVHHESNVLTQALGIQSAINISESGDMPYEKFDTFLICTDGVWGAMSFDQLQNCIGDYDELVSNSSANISKVISNQMIDTSSKRQDNFTSLIIKLMNNSNMKSNVTILDRIKRNQIPLLLFGLLGLMQIWNMTSLKKLNYKVNKFIERDSLMQNKFNSTKTEIYDIKNKIDSISQKHTKNQSEENQEAIRQLNQNQPNLNKPNKKELDNKVKSLKVKNLSPPTSNKIPNKGDSTDNAKKNKK